MQSSTRVSAKNKKWTWSVNKVFHNFDITWIVSDGVVATMLLSKPPLTRSHWAWARVKNQFCVSACRTNKKLTLCKIVKIPGLDFSNKWPITLVTAHRESFGGKRIFSWKTAHRQLRDSWKTAERQLRDSWETAERQLKDSWKTSERQLKDSWETAERLSRDSQDTACRKSSEFTKGTHRQTK